MANFEETVEQEGEFDNIEEVEEQQEPQAVEEPAVEEKPEVVIPNKYQGKSVEDIVKMHQEAEKLIGKQAQEVGEVRRLADELLKRDLNQTQAVEPPQEEDPEVDYFSDPVKAVNKAVENIHKIIAPALAGMEVTNQQEIDEKMLALDGTISKSKLGANAILGVSLAVLDAGSKTLELPLYKYINQVFDHITGEKPDMQMPTPMLNIINGGEHADNNVDIQEFMDYACWSQ